jgi:chromosome segregation ATPase
VVNKKPEKSVSGMDVLKDIRGLLSSNREPQEAAKTEAAREPGLSQAEKVRLEAQITELKTQVKTHLDEIGKAKADRNKYESQISELKAQVKTQQDEISAIKREKDGLASKQKTVKGPGTPDVEKSKFEAQVKDLQKQLQEQQQTLSKYKNEKEELAGKIKTLSAAKEKEEQLVLKPPVKNEDTVMLEARIADLTETMEQIDGLLKAKSQDLMKRIARVFNEAGQSDVAIEFRKGADSLESAENFARFLEILME